ncbi:MAG: hypothetical protein ACRD68_03275 [Pyrinomonadaceae bacterium]
MSIANELSCDVAAAMLAQREGRINTGRQELTEIVLEFHSTLRRLTGEARQRRRSQILLPPSQEMNNNTGAVPGNH